MSKHIRLKIFACCMVCDRKCLQGLVNDRLEDSLSSPHYRSRKFPYPALISFSTPYNLSLIHGYFSCFDEFPPFFQFHFLILSFLQKFMNNIEQYSFGDNFFYKIEDFQHIAPLARCHEDCVRVLGGRSRKKFV